MAQYPVGSGHVEVKIGQAKAQQEVADSKTNLERAEFETHVTIRDRIELAGIDVLQCGDRFCDV